MAGKLYVKRLINSTVHKGISRALFDVDLIKVNGF